MDIFKIYTEQKTKRKAELLTFKEYLKCLREDPDVKRTPAERLLAAIGKPELVDTGKDRKLGRIFGNRVIRKYKVFDDFYGLELVVDKIVSFFRHAAQGLEESRQILYLLGPVGSAKSSLAERLKELMEKEPIYALVDEKGEMSPIQESPLGVFEPSHAEALGLDKRYLEIKASPWAIARLEEYKYDINRFKVKKLYPCQDKQIAVSKTEPGDENNQDISALVGKLDIRKLEFFSQNDPNAYSYSGGLCLSNQGLLEFVEMFKAPIKVLHPLLTATQEKNYKGTEAIGAIPFDGIVLAHSNESEWQQFKHDKNNEAFLDRVCIVEVPYCLRLDEEVKIYKKLIESSALKNAPCAPGTLEMLAKFSVLSRLDKPDNSSTAVKLLCYNGENVKEEYTNAKSYQEYRDMASPDEGFLGVSTRLAYKILSEVYNFDPEEIAADPVHLLCVLEQAVKNEKMPKEDETDILEMIRDELAAKYIKEVGKEIQTAYLESYSEYGQALFDRYILFADHWVQDNDYREADTGQMFNREALDEELCKLEAPAGISNSKDFRHEIVQYALRYQARHKGKTPKWTAYEKLRRVIELSMFSKTEDLLPVISFAAHGSKEEKKKHEDFVARMKKMGYTERQIKRIVEWHMRASKE